MAWKPNDETHATRVLETVVADSGKKLKDKKHKLYKNPALALLFETAKAALKVVDDHDSKREKMSNGKFIYIGNGINQVVTGMAGACVGSMKKLGMAVPE